MADPHFLRLAVIDTAALAAAIGLAITGVRQRQAAELADSDAGDEVARTTTSAVEAPGQLARLVCDKCGGAVVLAEAPTVACPHCAASVAMPPAYLELVRGRALGARRLREEASALRRAIALTHPLAALAVVALAVAAGFGLVHLVTGAVAAEPGSWANDLGMVWIALLIAPVGFVVGSIGLLVAGAGLRSVARAFAAPRGDKGFACRGCGAPIAASADGDSEVCAYCGTQNLVQAALVAGAEREAKRAGSLGASIAHARAAARLAVWTALSIPCVLVGIVGGLVLGIMALVSWLAVL